VYGGLANKAICAINTRLRRIRLGSANNKGLVVERLIADGAFVEKNQGLAVCRTTESRRRSLERAATIAIQAAAVPRRPIPVSDHRNSGKEVYHETYQYEEAQEMGCGRPYPSILPDVFDLTKIKNQVRNQIKYINSNAAILRGFVCA
jgi:hypothetical protein